MQVDLANIRIIEDNSVDKQNVFVQAQTVQAQPPLRLPALKQIMDGLADKKARQNFLSAEILQMLCKG